MQHSNAFFILLALLPVLVRSAYLVESCSPSCYAGENDPVTIAIIATGSDVLPADLSEISVISISSPQSGSFSVEPSTADAFTFSSSKMTITFLPTSAKSNLQSGVVYGNLAITLYDSTYNPLLDNVPTGHIIYSVSMIGAVSPLSFGLQLSLRYISGKSINNVTLTAGAGVPTSYSGSSLDVSMTSEVTYVSVIAPEEAPFGFTLGEQIYVNVSFVDGNTTRFYLANTSDPQPMIGDVSATMLAPKFLPDDFAVPANISLLPNENAVVNKLQYNWIGGSFTCPSPSVRQVEAGFYKLICPSNSQILAASFGKLVSVVAIVNFQYVTRPEGAKIGFSLPKAPEILAPEFPYTFSRGEDPVLLIYGSNFYTLDPSLNIFNVTVGTTSSYICQGYAATNETVTCDIQGPVIPSDTPIYLTGLLSNGLHVSFSSILVAMSYSTAPVAPPMTSSPFAGPSTTGNSTAPQAGAAASGLQVGEIAGIVVVIAAVVILVIVLIVIVKRRRAASDNSSSDSDDSDEEELPEQPPSETTHVSADGPADGGSADSS